MSNSLLRILAALTLLSAINLAHAQSDLCHIPRAEQTTCSFTALNRSCTVTINRLHPVATPTIYMRRGSKVTVTVLHPSPFEKLSLDLKSSTAAPLPDEFAKNFSSLTGALAGFAIAVPGLAGAAPAAAPLTAAHEAQKATEGAAPKEGGDTPQEIAAWQARLLKKMNTALGDTTFNDAAKAAIKEIHHVEIPLPPNACNGATDEELSPWLKPADWKKDVDGELKAALEPLDSLLKDPDSDPNNQDFDKTSGKQKSLSDEVTDIQMAIAKLAPQLNQPTYDLLKNNQSQLTGGLGVIGQLQSQMADLDTAVLGLPDTQPQQALWFEDSQRRDNDSELQVWNLNYENRLGGIGKRVAADKYVVTGALSFSSIADQPNKQTIATVTVQYQHEPVYELSTGFIVPLRPYRSFTAAAPAATPLAPVVQETQTWTVVPAAFFNFPVWSWTADKHRMAILGTGAIGYTPATSSVALAVGPSLSFSSVVISPLADFGRDNKLVGGWTVGEALGGATAPQTSTFWDPKLSLGISVRIPIGQ